MPIIFQDVTGNSLFRPNISDVSTYTFDLPIKWTKVTAENRVGRVTVNRHIFFFDLKENFVKVTQLHDQSYLSAVNLKTNKLAELDLDSEKTFIGQFPSNF
jgi:hypothetical protein